ncbi:MAG: hypothetical protein WA979_01350 [Pacificimonas sp.]
MNAVRLLGLPLAIAAAACSEPSADPRNVAGNDAPSPAVDDPGLPTAEAPVGEDAPRKITLTGFICGDNCYLEFTAGGEPGTALCRASQCSDWADLQGLPSTLKGKRAVAWFGTGDQVDAAGNIMASDYPTITKLTISGRAAEAQTRPGGDGSSATGTQATGGGAGPLGLRTGIYTAGGDCGSIANAGLRVYDGTGLSGSATRDCRIEILSSTGQAHDVANDCADTYDGERSTQTFTVTVSGSDRFVLSDGESGTYAYCPVEELDPVMREIAQEARSARNPGNDDAAAGPTVPTRFQGLFALDKKACAEDYNYAPAFQNVAIEARRVRFFETSGPITAVNVERNKAAITLRETVGGGEFTRAIYLALNPDGTIRYRPGRSEPSRTYVRCAAD